LGLLEVASHDKCLVWDIVNTDALNSAICTKSLDYFDLFRDYIEGDYSMTWDYVGLYKSVALIKYRVIYIHNNNPNILWIWAQAESLASKIVVSS
jgi:hypothetical protein